MSNLYDNTSNAIHIKLKIKGTIDRIQLFHAICTKMDIGWPWPNSRTVSRGFSMCHGCEGRILTSPRMNAQDIAVAAKQAGIKVKIMQWKAGSKCSHAKNEYVFGPKTGTFEENSRAGDANIPEAEPISLLQEPNTDLIKQRPMLLSPVIN